MNCIVLSLRPWYILRHLDRIELWANKLVFSTVFLGYSTSNKGKTLKSMLFQPLDSVEPRDGKSNSMQVCVHATMTDYLAATPQMKGNMAVADIIISGCLMPGILCDDLH